MYIPILLLPLYYHDIIPPYKSLNMLSVLDEPFYPHTFPPGCPLSYWTKPEWHPITYHAVLQPYTCCFQLFRFQLFWFILFQIQFYWFFFVRAQVFPVSFFSRIGKTDFFYTSFSVGSGGYAITVSTACNICSPCTKSELCCKTVVLKVIIIELVSHGTLHVDVYYVYDA